MTPTQRTQDEADRVDLVYTYVLSQLGVKTTTEVLTLWQGVAAGQAAQTASAWLDQAIALILTRRGQARDLALAYYRLARALRTGEVTANPLNEEEEPDFVSLEMLRQEFEAIVAEHTGEGTTTITAQQEPSNDGDSIEVTRIDSLGPALAADEKSSEPYARKLLEDMAKAASDKVDRLSPDATNADTKVTTKDLHLQHGAMLAAAAARTAMNGGRNAVNQASARDARVIGWARQSTTGTPCYFCAMLISRRVLYKSVFSAGAGAREDGRVFLGDGMFKFHDNCHCVAEPIFSDAGIASNPKYAQNRYYGDLWDAHIKGKFSGDEAINEWRKLLKRIRTEAPSIEAAQVAA